MVRPCKILFFKKPHRPSVVSKIPSGPYLIRGPASVVSLRVYENKYCRIPVFSERQAILDQMGVVKGEFGRHIYHRQKGDIRRNLYIVYSEIGQEVRPIYHSQLSENNQFLKAQFGKRKLSELFRMPRREDSIYFDQNPTSLLLVLRQRIGSGQTNEA